MAPSNTVPTTPARARAGVAGAVVPTPEGCHPVPNWDNVEDQLGKGVNWPTAGRCPVMTPLVPTSTTAAATSHTVVRTRPGIWPCAETGGACPGIAERAVAPT